MKVTVEQIVTEKNYNFPCLMIDPKDNMIVLMINDDYDGIVLDKGTYNGIAYNDIRFDESFDPNQFKPFHGKITIEQ